MDIGTVHVDLTEVATALVTMYGGISVWSTRRAKARALIQAGRAEEVETSPLPDDPPPPAGDSNGKAP